MKPDWPFEQISDPPLRDSVCRQTYGIFEPLGFEKLVDLGIRKAGVRATTKAKHQVAPQSLADFRPASVPAASWHRHTNRQRPKLEVGPIAARSE